MAKPLVNDLLVLTPGLDPTRVQVRIKLYASTTTDAVAFTNAGTALTVGGSVPASYNAGGTLIDANGTVGVALNPNVNSGGTLGTVGTSSDAITTVGTAWEMTVEYPHEKPIKRYLYVPDGAGPYYAPAIQSPGPTAIADSAITAALNTKLTIANNLSDVASASTARTNLGLGSSATHAATDFAQVANNLSDLTTPATARTNLGLGNSATLNTGTTSSTVALGNAPTLALSRAAGGIHAIAIGDSNTAGYPAGNAVPPAAWWNEDSWFTQAVIGSRGMIRYLDNQGVSGTSSDTGLTRLTGTALPENPQLIIWQMGTNDAANGLTFQQSVNNVKSAITACQNAGVPIIICTPPPRSDGNSAGLTRVRTLAEWQRYYVRQIGSQAVMLADFQAVLTDPATGTFYSNYTYDSALHTNAYGAQACAQTVVDCVETYFRHKGIPPLTIFDGDTTTNTISGGNFTQALVASTPPGWTLTNGGGYTLSLVAPTAADHAVQRMPGNWYSIACSNVATQCVISQTSTLTPVVGNTIGFAGRIQTTDWVGDGGPKVWIQYVGTIAIATAVSGRDATQAGITAGMDGSFYIESTVPSGCTSIKVWAGTQKNSTFNNNMTGTMKVGALTVFDKTALNWGQY